MHRQAHIQNFLEPPNMDTNQIRLRSRLRRLVKWTLLGLFALFAGFVVAGLVIANSQDGSVRLLQSYLYSQWGHPANSFDPRAPTTDKVRADGVRIHSNLRYGTRYPNSFLDIWYPAADRTPRPTVIYIHGGGFFMGDKVEGDPLAAARTAPSGSGIDVLVKAGFNVVSIDYAFAPAYRYPVPVQQLDEVIRHLSANADIYGLDMTNVVIMGGSAGAQMTAQYGLLLSNPDYAREVGIQPSIAPANVKGLVVFSAPLKVSGFGWRMNTMMWAYLGTKDLEASRQARQMDLLPHIGPSYPATYVTDGNQPDTFPAHAKAMAARLREQGVDHVFNYYEEGEALLDHGYTARLDTKQGRENFERAIAFIRERTNGGKSDKSPTPRSGPRVSSVR
jgi:acetyl esterase